MTTHDYLVPVLSNGREIDGIWVRAANATQARQMARDVFDRHGYTRDGGYTLGKPHRDGDQLRTSHE